MAVSEDDPRWGTAVHEAGHAVAHYLLDIDLVEVSIVPNEDSEGHCNGAPVSREFWDAMEEAGSDACRGRFVDAGLSA
jgi:ATP-dependent Zn protease